MAASYGQQEISIEHRINTTLTDATTVVLSDPDGTYGIRNKSTLVVLVADGTAAVNESTGIYSYDNSGNGIKAITAYDPTATYEYSFEVTDADGNVFFVPGEFGPVAAGISFSEAYNEVRNRVGRSYGVAKAKGDINNALRLVANLADWYWKRGESEVYMALSEGVAAYSIGDTSVKEVVHAYLDGQHDLIVLDGQYHGRELNLYDRITGVPRVLYRMAKDIWYPDPLPDADYTVNLWYVQALHLTDDGDSIPGDRDVADLVIDKASQYAAGSVGKAGLYRLYGAAFNEKKAALKKVRKIDKFITSGDEDYMP